MITRRALAALGLLLFGCADSDYSSAGDPPLMRKHPRRGSRGNFVGEFDPLTASWRLRLQRPGWNEAEGERSFVFGTPGARPLVGDWDGDGAQTPGTFHAGSWMLSNVLGADAATLMFHFGQEGDVPVVGDWDGDGVATVGVYRNGTFSLRNMNTAGEADMTLPFGVNGVPVAGDWNGDGTDTVGVYKPDDGSFVLFDEREQPTTVALGVRMAQPVVGDWDDDRRDTIGIRLGTDWTLLNEHRDWLSRGQHPSYSEVNLPAAEVHGLGEVALTFGSGGAVAVTGNWVPTADRGFPAVPAELREFFPLAADYQTPESFPRWQDAGINTVIRVRSANDPLAATPDEVERWTVRANELGLKMIREPGHDVAADNAERNLLAFLLQDEPDIQPVDPYSDVVEAVTRLRAEGVTRRPLFVNFAGWPVLRQHDPYLKYGLGDRPGPDFYSRYVALVDWASQDIYAVSQMITQVGLSVDDAMATLPLTFDKLRRWAPTKPQFAYIETSQHNDNSDEPRELTPDEFRAQVWLAVASGARGVFYFAADDCGRTVDGKLVPQCTTPDGTRDDVLGAMRSLNARISRLTHALQGEVNPTLFSVSAAAPLKTAWRTSDAGNYIIAVNASSRPVERWLRMEGLLTREAIEVVDEQRSLEALGGYTFRDRFEPFEAHIYRFR